MKLHPVGAGEAYQLAYFRSEGAPTYAAEVEDWVAGTGWLWSRDDEDDVEDRRLLCFSGDDGLGGVVAHHRSGPGIRYLMVVFVDPDSRGKGLGRDLWAAAVEDASKDGDNVFWVVHPDNEAGLKLSDALARRAEPVEGDDGYVRFIYLGSAALAEP